MKCEAILLSGVFDVCTLNYRAREHFVVCTVVTGSEVGDLILLIRKRTHKPPTLLLTHSYGFAYFNDK